MYDDLWPAGILDPAAQIGRVMGVGEASEPPPEEDEDIFYGSIASSSVGAEPIG